MSHTPFAHAESLRIGSVEFISPDEVKVILEIEAPESVALNAGAVRPFPRVSGYVLMPVEDGYLVGQIAWLTIERSQFPKRRGLQDFGLIDLPFPLRRMSLMPLGTLRRADTGEGYIFRRGAQALPSIGASVLLPTETQLRSIVESGERRRVRIGVSPLAGNAEVMLDPDRIFGRHLAVLGNTGSGKSCSTAGLIRWSLEAAASAREPNTPPNARFIILDPNGEYTRAFRQPVAGVGTRIFRVSPQEGDAPLRVPLWFWNSAEWCSFTQASAKTQRPTLIQALRFARDGHSDLSEDPGHELRRFLRTIVITIRAEKNSGAPWGSFPKPKSFFQKLKKWHDDLEKQTNEIEGEAHAALETFVNQLDALCAERSKQYADYDFTRSQVADLLVAASRAHAALGGSPSETEPSDVDAPRRFSPDALLRSVEATAEMLNVSEHTETLLIRLRSLLKDSRISSIVQDSNDTTLDGWLDDILGKEGDVARLSVIDLSLVPIEVIHIVTAVIARVVFEALQRYRKLAGRVLPTVLVMEEAHNFVKRYRDEVEHHEPAAICCQIFERIAREGRKFGLGLVLSSQRPSELSPTVLSQCNTFLLHRISNDRDQELVQRLVPDNLRGLLREMPLLPSQYGILLGWASELPVLVRLDDLAKPHQPQSDDPDFWNVWVGKNADGVDTQRSTDWKRVADDWQATSDL